jgi:cytoskeletal protein CcmA (bactofilin family)
MFSKKNKPTGSLLSSQKPADSAKPAVPSIISRDLVLTGDLNSDGEVQVDGKVIGAMKRQGKEGEFRSNLHRGGNATIIELKDLIKLLHNCKIKTNKIR